MLVRFMLAGMEFVALTAQCKLSEAASLAVPCEMQSEIDSLWWALTAKGGAESLCGWLKDRFGFPGRSFPEGIYRMLNDAEKGARYGRRHADEEDRPSDLEQPLGGKYDVC
jgi:predicted 3-demethylubiquinone-9 3-methyltransferase (glyoxalase superfamily)